MPKEEKNKQLSYNEIQLLIADEIKSAEEYQERRSSRRITSWDRYYGKKLGNEVKGRSQFITREVMDTIEWMMPYFIRTFASGDPKVDIEIEKQPSWVGKAMMDKIQLDLGNSTPNLFMIIYQWCKDALVSDTAFVKSSWTLDQETITLDFSEISAENMQQLASDPDVNIMETGEASLNPEIGVIFQNVAAKVKKTIKDKLYAENTPNWEFIAHPKSRDINDEYGKGHKTEVTLDYLKRIDRAMSEKGKPYFRDLNELVPKTEGIESDSSQKTRYMEDEESTITPLDKEDLKAPIKFIEWYTRIDVNGDGYLENIVCHRANNKLIRWEINKDDFIPFSAIKPIIDCYKFFGISYADLIIEIQNLKTMVFRRILDNFDFQNTGRWRIDPDGSVDISSVLNNRPGTPIFGRKGTIEDLTPQPFNPGVFNILEYVDKIKQNRTGIKPYTQEKPQETATGVIHITDTILQRLDLIGRIFAETGLKDFYKKCVLLYQKYLRKPFTAKVQGQEREITPEIIQGNVVCKVNMGIEASIGMQEAHKIERMLAVLFQLHQAFPGLLTPEKIHNLSRRYITSLGFKQIDDFISNIQEYMQQIQQQQGQMQQQSQMQEQIMQLQEKLQQMEVMLKGEEIKIKGETLKQKGQIETMKVEQKDRDSQRDYNIGLLQVLQGLGGKEVPRLTQGK